MKPINQLINELVYYAKTYLTLSEIDEGHFKEYLETSIDVYVRTQRVQTLLDDFLGNQYGDL